MPPIEENISPWRRANRPLPFWVFLLPAIIPSTLLLIRSIL